jgi:hypothetical protein
MSAPLHIEWVPFHVGAGVDDTDFINAADALTREFLSAQPGFVRRELLRAADGSWVDCVAWRAAADHHSAMERMSASPAALHFMSLLADPEAAGAAMQHFSIARAWP